MCDLDHFKAYNDALGHVAGDEALRTVAQVIARETRTSDSVYRYGGEELAVIMTSKRWRLRARLWNEFGWRSRGRRRHTLPVRRLLQSPSALAWPSAALTMQATAAIC